MFLSGPADPMGSWDLRSPAGWGGRLGGPRVCLNPGPRSRGLGSASERAAATDWATRGASIRRAVWARGGLGFTPGAAARREAPHLVPI